MLYISCDKTLLDAPYRVQSYLFRTIKLWSWFVNTLFETFVRHFLVEKLKEIRNQC